MGWGLSCISFYSLILKHIFEISVPSTIVVLKKVNAENVRVSQYEEIYTFLSLLMIESLFQLLTFMFVII